jgi:serine/threonine protein kinase
MVKVGIGSEAGTAAADSKRPHSPPPSPADVARHFPHLEVIELLGSGGMGAVYKARQREIDRLVALKILPSDAASDPGFAERFTREARALAKLNHPNIVALYDFGRVNGLHYFIMEYVDGLNLRQLEQAGQLSPREALQIIPQICEALQFAHDEGIVHRDIKPENVLLDKKGRVKIADFGLARILGHEPEDFRLTRAREVMGTPHYMAPEQVEKPQSVDHRADIYSLGVVFYEMLTGELPLGKFDPPSQKVRIDVRLDDVVLRALEKEPARRYQHASEVKTDMETIMTEPPASTVPVASAQPGSGSRQPRLRRRIMLPAAAVALVVLAVGLAWLAKRAGSSGPDVHPGDTLLVRRRVAEASAPTAPAPAANPPSAEAAKEAFARRYGLAPPAPSPSAAESTEQIFARRYGLRPSAPSPATNASDPTVAASGTAPLSYQWQFATNSTMEVTTPGSPANVTFAVVTSGTVPLSYQWNVAPNATSAVTNPGPEGLILTRLAPLYVTLALEGVATNLASGPRYIIGIEDAAAPTPGQRAKRQYYCSIGSEYAPRQPFTLRDVKAPADNPTVVLELNATKESISVDKDHPFQRVRGYAADLKYGPENKTWLNRRVGSVLAFGGDDYEIVASTPTEVVLRQKSNNKTWAVEYDARVRR